MCHSILIDQNLYRPRFSMSFDQQMSKLFVGFEPRQLMFCFSVLSFQQKLFYSLKTQGLVISNSEITLQCSKRMCKRLVATSLNEVILFFLGQLYFHGTAPIVCGGLTGSTYLCDCYRLTIEGWIKEPSLSQCVLAPASLVISDDNQAKRNQ